MGCGASSEEGEKGTSDQVKKMNAAIEKRVSQVAKEDRAVVKIMLLGSGECGKSTILKQMKLLNLGKFTPEEEAEARDLVFKNTLDSIQTLISANKDLQIPYTSTDTQEKADRLMKIDSSETISLDIAQDIIDVWADEGTKACKKRESEFHLLDSAPYFLDKVKEYFVEGFVPSIQDVLRTRLTTTGIVETNFTMEGKLFRMFDVGGQRGERKYWIHCFDNVTAVMFIGSLSEYDQTLAEDRTKNRLIESWDLFEDVVNLPCFANASIVLFLNKSDLYEEKMNNGIGLGTYIKNYTGPECDYQAGIDYILEEYKMGMQPDNNDEERELYHHVTNATNRENVQKVWEMTKSIILDNKMSGAGF
jgi:GTPase SAR1 family protein